MCALESGWKGERETPARRWMRERGRGRERWLYLVAPNKATLAFQDERQVYRRKFMRAELQRVELDLREGRRMSWRGAGKGECGWARVRGSESSRSKSTRVESSRVESGSIPVVVRGKLCPFSSRGDPSTGAISAGVGEFCARSWRRQRRRRIIPRRKEPRHRRPAPSSPESLRNNERAGQIDEMVEKNPERESIKI